MTSNKKKKSISFFLPNLEVGGAEKVIVSLANKLYDRGYKVEILVSSKSGNLINQINNKIIIQNFSAKKVLFSFNKLNKYLRNNSPDILFATHTHTAFVSFFCIALNSFKTKLILRKAISPGISFSENFLYKFIIIFISKINLYLANTIIVPSIKMLVDLKNSNKPIRDKFFHIYNPIDFEIIRKKSKLDEKNYFTGKYLLAAARLQKQKDFYTLIKAFKTVSNKYRVNLLILGEGDDRKSIEEYIISCNLENRICMPGIVENPYYYMKRCELFVHSSKAEGLPNSLLQAICLNKVVVCTDCDYGPREIIEGSNFGKLVPVGDHNLMASQINKLLSNKEKLLANKEFLRKFEIEKIVDAYEKVLFLRDE